MVNDKVVKTHDGTKGGVLSGKRHKDENGNPIGGIKAIVADTNRPVELESGEVIITRKASEKHWKTLSKINQDGGGVAIGPPSQLEDDPTNYEGGGLIRFNPNHLPKKHIIDFAKSLKADYPSIWDKAGNTFGNTAFENLKRASDRGYWLDDEKWMYIKWRAYVARHKQDFRLNGVIAMLKWGDHIEKGFNYMRRLIENEIAKETGKEPKKNPPTKKKIVAKKKPVIKKMESGGSIKTPYKTFETKLLKIKSKVTNSDEFDIEVRKALGKDLPKNFAQLRKDYFGIDNATWIKWQQNQQWDKMSEVNLKSLFDKISEKEQGDKPKMENGGDLPTPTPANEKYVIMKDGKWLTMRNYRYIFTDNPEFRYSYTGDELPTARQIAQSNGGELVVDTHVSEKYYGVGGMTGTEKAAKKEEAPAVYTLEVGDKLRNAVGYLLTVQEIDDESYYLSAFDKVSALPWGKAKVDNYLATGQWKISSKNMVI